MKHKTGYTEAVILAIFICIPQLIINYISYGLSNISSGYLINFTICTIIFWLLILPVKNSFVQNFNVYTNNSIIEKIISIVLCCYILVLTLYNLKICVNSLGYLTKNLFKSDIVAFLAVISAVVCSYQGIEAISRTAYFVSFICVAVIVLICGISINGFEVENLYPLLGSSYKSTLLDFSSIGVYCSLFAIYIIRDAVIEPKKSFEVLKKAMTGVYVGGIILILICILAIPYPMMKHYGFSLSAIFSVAKSSVLFHRFEILLILFMMLLTTVALSTGISLFSKKISALAKSHDIRPYTLVVGTLIFYLCMLIKNDMFLKYIFIGLSVLLYVCLAIKTIITIIKRKKKRGCA